MDLNNLTLFQMAMTKMDWAGQRQKVLSQNIANADTPDYKEHDLKKLDFKQLLHQASTVTPVKVAQTNPMHLPGTIPPQAKFRVQAEQRTFEESPDGNKVVIEEQMEKIGDTNTAYSGAITLMEAQMKMMRDALDKSGG
jgi:flagellar basal-body rod protein FlgB